MSQIVSKFGLKMPSLRQNAAAELRSYLCEVLIDLYRKHSESNANNSYLQIHSRLKFIQNQVRTFQWYRPYLPKSGTILDWGCQHAPDACLLRAATGDQFDLHSCDFFPAADYSEFHSFANANYKQLDDIVRLPYPSGKFDVVIGSGVLEHVAMDYESLKEIYRILKPNGILIGSYLPNRLSSGEWRRRVLWKRDFHMRLYSPREITMLLKHTGFLPLQVQHQIFYWDRWLGRLGLGNNQNLRRILKVILPMHLVSSTLCFVARRATNL